MAGTDEVTVTAGAPLSRDELRTKLEAKGYPPAMVEGMLRNMLRESGGSTSIMGDHGTSGGLFQHHAERLDEGKAYAKAQGKPWNNADVQIDFADQELKTKFPELRKELMSETDPARAEDKFKRIFERPASVMWSSNASGGPLLGTDRFRFSDYAMGENSGRHNSSLMYMSPDDYLALSPTFQGDHLNDRSRKSLLSSVDKGDEIDSVPSLDVKVKGPTATVTGQDGRHRAYMAGEEGLDQIPVAINQTGQGSPSEITGMQGNTLPMNFQPADKVSREPSGRGLLGRVMDTLIPSAQAQERPSNTADDDPFAKYTQTPEEADPFAKYATPTVEVTAKRPVTDEALVRKPSPEVEKEVPLKDEPGYHYGTILPYRVKEDAEGNTIPGTAEWAVPELFRAPARGAVKGGQVLEMRRPLTKEDMPDIMSAASLGAVASPVNALKRVAPLNQAKEIVSRIYGRNINWADEPAARLIASKLDKNLRSGAVTAEDIIELLNSAPHKPLNLADVAGGNVLGLLGRVARQPGESSVIVKKALEDRDLNAGNRLISDTNSALGGGSAYDAGKVLSDARSKAAGPKYEEAFAQPLTIDDTRQFQIFVVSPEGQEAINRGMHVISLEKLGEGKVIHPEQYGVVRSDQGTGKFILDPRVATGEKAPSLRLLDAVKRGFQQMVDDNRDQYGVHHPTDMSRAADMARYEITRRLKEAFPKYKEALDAWAGPSESKRALNIGQNFQRMRPEEIRDNIKGFSAADREFFKLGVADKLRQEMSKKGVHADESKAIIGNQAMRDRLRPAFDNDADFNRFIKAVEAEQRMFDTRYDALKGSQTAARLAEDTNRQDLAGSMQAAQGVAHLASGSPGWGLMHLGRSALDFFDKLPPSMAKEIAQTLTKPLNDNALLGRLSEFRNMMRVLPTTSQYLRRRPNAWHQASPAAMFGAPGQSLMPSPDRSDTTYSGQAIPQ